MWPRSRRASRIASARVDSVAGLEFDRYPISETFFGCCASADEQSAKSMAQSVRTVIFLVMFVSRVSTRHSTLDTRPFSLDSLRTSFRALCITRIQIKESVIYTAEGDRIRLPKTRGRHETELYGLVRQISKDRFVPDQFKLHVNKTLRRRFTRANPRRTNLTYLRCWRNQFNPVSFGWA